MNITQLSRTLCRTLSMQPRLKKLAENRTGRDYFVGDICGHYPHLMRALKKSDFHPHQDRLFCTGNTVNYGQCGEKVLQLLKQPWFFSVIGIQELLMRHALESGHHLHWHTHGGEWAFDDNMQLRAGITALQPLLNKLPLALQIEHKKLGTIGMLSSGPGALEDWQHIPGLNAQQAVDTLFDETLPVRKQSAISGVDYLVVGNQIAQEPWCRGNIVGINLGARLLPERGQLLLTKAKKLAKVREQHTRYKSVD